MPRASRENIEKLEERKRALELKLKTLRAQQQREERKKDARRKILIGGALISAVQAGKVSEELLGGVLDEFVTKERDRAFLGLAPKEQRL